MNNDIGFFNIKDKSNFDESNQPQFKDLLFNVSFKYSDVPQESNVLLGFNKKLNEQRNLIDRIDSDIWKKVRWYINDYDFMVKDPIINRAFYKYWEIINEFDIFENFNNDDIIFHCAEAPGGFIQGSNIFLQLDQCVQPQKEQEVPEKDSDGFTMVSKKKRVLKLKPKIYSISLNKEISKYITYNLPSYNKTILNKYTCISYGQDNTGDINNLNNTDYLKKLIKDTCYLVTADGGFDEGNDFNNKEQLHYYLILNEIYTCINLQKQGGSFILKVFDIFTNTSLDMIYLLNILYDEIYVYKPKTSRPTNSEKYIICKNFNCSRELLDKVSSKLKILSTQLKMNLNNKSKYASFTIFENIPDTFIKLFKEMNEALLNRQCSYLNRAIQLCEDSNFSANYENELNVSLERRRSIYNKWEKQYNLNYFIPN